jgi:uncharacterized protein (UPF0303 family)
MSADIEFEIVKQPLEEINKQYEGCDFSSITSSKQYSFSGQIRSG